MAEYIDREAVMSNEFCDGVCCQDCPFCIDAMWGGCKVASFIETIPAADVKPVVRGSWTRFDYFPVGHDYECSKCGYMNDMMSNYCPNCGADMREVDT